MTTEAPAKPYMTAAEVVDEVRAEFRQPRKVTRTAAQVESDSLYPVPSEASLDGELTESPALNKIAEDLLERHDLYAAQCKILVRWRDKGGKSKGRKTLAKIVKASGWNAHLSQASRGATPADFLIWIAADHLREMGATKHQVEACLYSQLVQVGETEPPADEAKAAAFVPEPCLLAPDAVIYCGEVLTYGLWNDGLRSAGAAIKQMSLEIGGE